MSTLTALGSAVGKLFQRRQVERKIEAVRSYLDLLARVESGRLSDPEEIVSALEEFSKTDADLRLDLARLAQRRSALGDIDQAEELRTEAESLEATFPALKREAEEFAVQQRAEIQRRLDEVDSVRDRIDTASRKSTGLKSVAFAVLSATTDLDPTAPAREALPPPTMPRHVPMQAKPRKQFPVDLIAQAERLLAAEAGRPVATSMDDFRPVQCDPAVGEIVTLLRVRNSIPAKRLEVEALRQKAAEILAAGGDETELDTLNRRALRADDELRTALAQIEETNISMTGPDATKSEETSPAPQRLKFTGAEIAQAEAQVQRERSGQMTVDEWNASQSAPPSKLLLLVKRRHQRIDALAEAQRLRTEGDEIAPGHPADAAELHRKARHLESLAGQIVEELSHSNIPL